VLIGVTTPHEDSDVTTQQCSIIFCGNVTLWLNRLKNEHSCGYDDNNRSDYVEKMVNWIVGHELGRQIGKLHSINDAAGEHNLSDQTLDYMRNLWECEPISADLGNNFCPRNGGDTLNNCMDKWKTRFPPPPP